MEKFVLEVPSLERGYDAIDYIKEFIKNKSPIHGSGQLQNYLDNYEGWLDKLITDKEVINWVFLVNTETYFLVRKNDNKIVGMSNIRLELTKALAEAGGHIGYGIRPSERGRGYSKILLYLSLKKCLEHDIKEVTIVCDNTNELSRKTILALGGIYQSSFDREDRVYEKYVIPVEESLEKNKDTYEAMCA